MRRSYVPGILVAAIVLLLGTTARTRTWTVERDGSGDFGIIQSAVNAAASGDTVLIGPGRYDEGEVVSCPGWTEYVRVLVTVPVLTLIGSGDETIIGQEELWELGQGFHMGVVAAEWFGNESIKMSGLRFENVGHGIYTDSVDVDVRSCSFVRNVRALGAIGNSSIVISDCSFLNMERDGTHLSAFYSDELVVRDCRFVLWDHHEWNQTHFNTTGVQSMLVEDCEFLEGAAGTILGISSNGEVRNCLFDGQSVVGVGSGPGSDLAMTGCTFKNQFCVANITQHDARISARRCEVDAVVSCTLRVFSAESISFQECDLAGGELGVVWVDDCSVSPPQHLDFTNNYWGTDDPDSIEALIRDYTDTEDACWIVDYEPFRAESTPVESMSLSDLKALLCGGGK